MLSFSYVQLRFYERKQLTSTIYLWSYYTHIIMFYEMQTHIHFNKLRMYDECVRRTLIYISNFENFSDAYALRWHDVATYTKKGWKTNYVSGTYMELEVKNVIFWRKRLTFQA